MSKNFKNELSNLMHRAWMLVKVYGLSMSDAMRKAWLLLKLNKKLHKGIVKFYYEKLSGEVRTAWGTLKSDLIPSTAGDNRKRNDSVFVYYDQEKESFRCFKIANLLKIV